MAESSDKQTSLHLKRASGGSSTSNPRSRPHSAAELYLRPASFQNSGEVTGEVPSRTPSGSGPRQLVDATRNAITVEDEPDTPDSPLNTRREELGNTGTPGSNMSGVERVVRDVEPKELKGSPKARRTSRRQSRPDDNALPESPYEHLTEIVAPAPAPPRDRFDEEDLYQGDSVEAQHTRPPDRRQSARRERTTRKQSLAKGSSSRTQVDHRRRSSHDPEHDLTELVAPGPTVRSPSRFQPDDLENELESGAGYSPESDQDKLPPSKPSAAEGIFEHLFILSYLVFFSIFGTLARLGLQWLTFYPGAPTVLGVLWANFAGSLFMGFLSEDRMLFREAQRGIAPSSRNTHSTLQSRGRSPNPAPNDPEKAIAGNGFFRRRSRMSETRFAAFLKLKKSIPLYIGLTTGFCGSFTSFSSFLRDVFLALSNDLPTPFNHPTSPPSTTPSYFHAPGPPVHREGGYSFMAPAAIIILTITASLGALKVGAHLALALEHAPFPLHIFGTPTLRSALDFSMPILAIGSWLGAVFMAIWPPDRPGGPAERGGWDAEVWRGEAVFACVFAPVGCLVRYHASLYMNALAPSFPLGTFAANVFGTAVLGMAWDLQHVRLGGSMVGGGRVGCQVLQGVMDGFCGALTTVSTWVVELDGLRRRHAWIYGTSSLGAGLGLLVVIMGSVRWSVGWTAPACMS